MGYGYGVCLVYDDEELLSIHIPHFPIAQFMTKEDAFALQKKLSKKTGPFAKIDIKGEAEIFYPSYREYDNNKLCSWGYTGKCDKWRLFSIFAQDYNCKFVPEPYTSMRFAIYPKKLKPRNITDKEVHCKIYAMDLRSDFPEDWKVIKENIPSFL